MHNQLGRAMRIHSVRWMLFAAALLILTIAGEKTTVFAAPGGQLEIATYRLIVTPDDTVTLCPGQKREFDAYLDRYVLLSPSRWNLHPASAWSDQALEGQIIESNVANRQVGSIALISTATRQIGTFIYPYVPFVFKARHVGTTNITFSDQGPDTNVAQGRPRASPQTRTVEVKDCKYHLIAFSQWTFPDGFRPHAMLVLDAEFTPDQDGNFRANGTVENAAHHLLQMQGGDCSDFAHYVDVDPSTALVTGKVDFDNEKMVIRTDYESVTANTRIRCVVPFFGDIGNGNFGPGAPLQLSTRPLNFTANVGTITAGNLPHVLHSYEDVTGITSIMVIPEPQ